MLLAGGFGSGKTTGLVQKVMQLAAVNGPAITGAVVAHTWRGFIAVTYRNLCRQLIATLGRERAAPMVRIHGSIGARYLDWWGGNGEPIFLCTAQNPAAIDGLNLGWAAGDELRHWPKHSFEVTQSRVRVPCKLSQRAYASTPAIGYMSEEFNTGKPNRELIRAPTRENAHNLQPGYEEELRRSYGPRLAKAMLDGNFVPLEGAVYEALSPDIWARDLLTGEPQSEHIIDYDPEKFRHLETHLAVDPGYRASAWLWIHQHPREDGSCDWVVFDQIMPDRMSDADCIEMVNRKGWPIDKIMMDPAGDATQSALGLSTTTMLAGINTRARDVVQFLPERFRDIPMGVERVRALLGGQGAPVRLRFASRLKGTEDASRRGLLRSLISYVYPDPDKRVLRRLDLPFKDNINDHACDALRYWAVVIWLQHPELRRMLEEAEGERRWERAA